MHKISCPHVYQVEVKLFSGFCAAIIAILAIVIAALSIPQEIFMMGEFWGVGIHRYQIIACSGMVVCFPAYRLTRSLFCWRCPGPKEKPPESRFGFQYIV